MRRPFPEAWHRAASAARPAAVGAAARRVGSSARRDAGGRHRVVGAVDRQGTNPHHPVTGARQGTNRHHPVAGARPGASGPNPAVGGAGGLGRMAGALRRRLTASGRDLGANPVELAVTMPVILVLLFASIQVAAWFVARSTALNAAQGGVNAQRVLAAEPGDGEERAVRFLRATGDWLVGWDEPGPSCETGATEVTCTVSGRSLSVIPGVSFPVRQTAHGTVERWTTP